ncbi:MAG: hypothetical protein JXN61_03030 [Sedimentisphaerales bacterium]|nr:hypothetical protein [Sedimentisphaerales bacterium]
MVDTLQSFEQACGRLSPLVLIGPGIAALVIGLFVWLGGVGFRNWLLGIAGGLSGVLLGFFVFGLSPLLTAAFAGIAAAGAAAFQRLFIAVLAGVLSSAIGFCLLAGPYLGEAGAAATPAKQNDTLSWGQSARLMKSYSIEFDASVRLVYSQMPGYKRAILAAVAAAGAAGGFRFRRAASALCFAVLGTAFIFAGMILLLLQKGSGAISGIFHEPPFYAIVFTAMAAFGAVEQLIFCKQKKEESEKAEEGGKGGDESASAKGNWRTA